MKIKRRFKITPEIDMTPFTVFLMNLFFLFFSSYFLFQPGIKVSQPRGTSGGHPRQTSVEITITHDDMLFYNSDRISLEELKLKFKSLSRNAPSTIIIIRADDEVRHSRVLEIMNAAKENFLSKIAIASWLKE